MEVSIPDLNGEDLLLVRGKVIHQTQLEGDGRDQHRVGLEFKNLSEPVRACLAQLLYAVLQQQDEE